MKTVGECMYWNPGSGRCSHIHGPDICTHGFNKGSQPPNNCPNLENLKEKE
ncbi:MAG: hypothetical protein ACOC2U_03270 [bacterium]